MATDSAPEPSTRLDAPTAAALDAARTGSDLAALYEADETGWLEAMARLIAAGRQHELDHAHLREYLEDMAGRDRREVKSRLKVLLLHLLKWHHQPDFRTTSWSLTIDEQREQLADLLQSRTLREHGQKILAQAYLLARRAAAKETGQPPETYPVDCPFTLDSALSDPLPGE